MKIEKRKKIKKNVKSMLFSEYKAFDNKYYSRTKMSFFVKTDNTENTL